MEGSRAAAAKLRRETRRLGRLVPYGVNLLFGRPAGELRFHLVPPGGPLPPPWLEVQVRAAAVSQREAAQWCRRQTLRELVVVGRGEYGEEVWRVDAEGEAGPSEAPYVLEAPGLPEGPPSHLDSTLLVATAEAVDGVLNLEGVQGVSVDGLGDGLDLPLPPQLLPFLVMRRAARRLLAGPGTTTSSPKALLKAIGPEGFAPVYEARSAYGRRRRGPYLSARPLGPELSVGVRDASRLLECAAQEPSPEKPPLLVLTSFLATGGAEHTLFETLRVLRDRFELTIVTLAPHRRERGDRRSDFRTLTERLYCLGDLMHPAAMAGILLHLVDRYGVRHVYNANGTTVFYELAPQLKAARPGLRIVDHLYDHRVGYIDRYTPELAETVDACVAENHRIAEVLVEERGFSPERVPVIWPCGRAPQDLPDEAELPELRRRAREIFGAGEDELVILTAARMHPQKRPLDLVSLAERFREQGGVRFVVVGGGDLETEVDAAIAASNGAPIVRLPFRTDIPELIVGADVGCLVSDYEGLPVFMIECFQLGRPFLGTAVGEMGEVLEETGAGLVVERPGDLELLAAAVERLCDPATRDALAERARRAARRFDVDACAEAYARAFLGGGG